MPELSERIEEVLNEKVRPQLEEHDGNILAISFQNGVFTFRLTGGCSGCPSADITVESIIKKELLAAIPEIKEVVRENGVSESLYRLARDIMTHKA